jgi:hypothetical protein
MSEEQSTTAVTCVWRHDGRGLELMRVDALKSHVRFDSDCEMASTKEKINGISQSERLSSILASIFSFTLSNSLFLDFFSPK